MCLTDGKIERNGAMRIPSPCLHIQIHGAIAVRDGAAQVLSR